MAYGDLITTIDEFQDEYRKTVGQTLPHRPSKQANIDNIRRFGDGVGDYNPLWRDEAHAAASRYGMITASPPFLFGVTLGVVAGETGGIDRRRVSTEYLPVNYAGAEIEFVRPIWRDDTITASETVGRRTIRKTSSRIGAINFNTGFVTFTNQRKEVVATIKTTMARYQNMGHTLEYDRSPREGEGWQRRRAGRSAGVGSGQRQGAETRHWEDVAVGDALSALPKGTYSVTELFLFTHGVLGTGRTSRAALAAEGSADLGGGGRFDEEHARKRRNMPGQFDFGPQRVCWLSQVVTDWMGDDGVLKTLSAQIRHPNVVGDTNAVHGEVTGKSVAGDEHLVEVQVRNLNQSGLPTALGTATVALPSRGRLADRSPAKRIAPWRAEWPPSELFRASSGGFGEGPWERGHSAPRVPDRARDFGDTGRRDALRLLLRNAVWGAGAGWGIAGFGHGVPAGGHQVAHGGLGCRRRVQSLEGLDGPATHMVVPEVEVLHKRWHQHVGIRDVGCQAGCGGGGVAADEGVFVLERAQEPLWASKGCPWAIVPMASTA